MDEIEATGLPAFLAEHPPFAGVARSELLKVASSASIQFFPAGETILTEDGPPAEWVYVVRRGTVHLTSGGEVVDVLHEGEMFGHPSVLSGRSPSLGVRAPDDAICLLIAPEVISTVFGGRGGLGFLVTSLRRRIGHAAASHALRTVTVRSLMRRPALVVEQDESVMEASRLMTENDVTAVLVHGDQGSGIVTDRDLRERVLGAGKDGATPVGEAATRPVRGVGPDSLADDALIEMLDQGVRHLPVVEKGSYLGLLEIVDLVGLGRLDPFDVHSSLHAAPSVESMVTAAERIPNTVASVIEAGVGAPQVGRIVASFTDAMTRAAIRLALEDQGPAPVAWSWVALGSQARREQGLVSDQDHSIIYAAGGAAHDVWFGALADRVVATLEACGIPRCPNGVMASEAGWRSELPARVEEVERWMTIIDRGATLFTGIALDYRQVSGDLDVTISLDEVVQKGAANAGFLYRCAELAVEQKLPIGFFGNLVVRDVGDRAGSLDIKAGGIHPVVELGRLFALRAGVGEVGTIDRLSAAVRAGVLDEERAAGLIEAYAVLLNVRLKHQVEQWRSGRRPDNLIDPRSLGPLARAQLKDAFGIIREVQRMVARDLLPRPSR